MITQQKQTLTLNQQKRKDLLDLYAKKQSFRVAKGKSKWVEYQEFSPEYNLREILKDEIVIEFDIDNKKQGWIATNETCINLYKAGLKFSIWSHNGRSPHIHIQDLPIAHLEKDKLALFKKLFIKKYTPSEFLKYADTSLCGVHLVRLEWSPCWKGKYGVKELVYEFDPNELK